MFTQVILVGRLGKDAEVRNTQGGRKVATLSVATSESWKDKNSGEWKERTNWHTVITWQPGLVELIEKRAKKGRLVQVVGALEYRSWRKDGEDTDRKVAEVAIGPNGQLIFLDKTEGAGAGDDLPN